MLSAHDDQERLAAQSAAATALSEHIARGAEWRSS
jgi:hypothetical protein